MKKCLKCNTDHSKDGDFCSRSCANSRGPRSQATKDAISKALAGRIAGESPKKGKTYVSRIDKVCPNCGTGFQTTEKRNKIYCSSQCFKKCSGGERVGSGRGKTGYYKGIYCGSTYELVWVIYQLDHKLPFSRFEGFVEHEGKRYFPDFLQYGKIVELKGYEDKERVDAKTKIANLHGYDVIVLKKNDLKKEFEWVKKNYLYKELQELYDNYKPLFQYECGHCGCTVNRSKKSKTEYVFCSRQCAGKGIK